MLIHREALELARNAASVGEGIPFAMSCVEVTPDGTLTVVDGKHWLRMKAAADEPNLFDELAEKDTERPDAPVLVPAEVMSAFRAAMKKRKVKKGEPVPHVVVAQQGDRITLRSSDGRTMRTFLLEAVGADLTFPNVDRTVQGAYAPVRWITFSVDLLRVVLRTLHACKVESVRLGIPDMAGAAISLSAFSETGPITGAVMPMRDPEEARTEAGARLDAAGAFEGQQPDEGAKEFVDRTTGEIRPASVVEALQEAIDTLIAPQPSGSCVVSVTANGKTTTITPEQAEAARTRQAARRKKARS